jgi:hypothetical protein
MDNLASELSQFIKVVESFDGKKVVQQSQQTYGTTDQKMLTLRERLSQNPEDAMARAHLENTQLGLSTPADDTLDEKIVGLWADDIITKAIDKIFGA